MANKTEVLYVKQNNSLESEDEGEGDIWDDRKLNLAYDKALSIANAEVAKRVAMSTNNQNKQLKDVRSSSKKQKSHIKNNSSKDQNIPWKVDMPCRAIYEGDYYEASVIKIIDDECVVKFVGYNNSEIVPISTLKASLGTEERNLQIQDALEECKTDESYTAGSETDEKRDYVSDRATSPSSTVKSVQRNNSAKKMKNTPNLHKQTPKKKTPNRHKQMPVQQSGFEIPEMPFPMPKMPGMRNFQSSAMEMPLPPPPPPIQLSGRCDSEDQAISSMLLSWYMSGYYTGLYQGMKRAKEGRRNE